MKKNVLFIVLDSITNDVLFNKTSSKFKAPFLYQLRKKSISGDKMYSEAPYTEAALKALLGSVDTMDNNGYIEKYKHTYLVTEEFQKNGYYVFSNAFYPNIYPKYSLKGIDEKKYFEGYSFNSLWEYRLKYYEKMYLSSEISKDEKTMLADMLEDNIESWILYLNKLKNNDIETSLINKCVKKDNIQNDILKLENEFLKFKTNKTDYLNDLFKQKQDHILFKINNYHYDDKIKNDEYRLYFMQQVKRVLKKVKFVNFKYNLKNNKLPYKQLLYLLKNKNFKVFKGVLAGYKNSLFDKDLYKRCEYNFDLFKAQRSFKYMSKEFETWLNKNNNYPWFSYIHVDDAHYPESFLSYDIADKNNLLGELEKIKQYIKNLPKNYKGSLAYDLSLLYCDSVIKEIFEFLEAKNILENTVVVITADHGYSYSFCPPRDKYVLSNYNENYNVPYIVYNSGVSPKMINEFRTTKDIPATLLNVVGIQNPKSFKGMSVLKKSEKDYVTIEYMGGGCPDILRRPINLGIRTSKYLVVMDVYLYKKFEESNIKEVYNLINDYKEQFNIANIISKNSIKYEISLIENRYNELREEYHCDKG